ncbi:MAG TPA: FtsX-like permease family protein [Chitinophagaceae bacterium]
MNFLFAWRYFKAKKSTNAINVIAWISILAIVVGTAALILVLSVFNGFEDLVKSLYSSFYPDMKVIPASGKQLTLTQEQINKLRSVKGVHAVSLVVEEKAMLINGDYQANAYMKGVDEQYTKVAGVKEHLIKGNFDLGDSLNPKLILGAGIENAIGVQSDRSLEPVLIYTGRKGDIDLNNPLNNVSSAEAFPAGAFIIQQDFDNKYALTHISFLKMMLEMQPDTYSAAEISLPENTDPGEVQEALQRLLGKNYLVQNRFEQNRSLYAVMRAEKWVIYAILSLILVVAAFNMVGALTMLVLEKKEDINVLHALGADRSLIQKIFLSEGLLLALIGGAAGMVIAYTLAILQINFKLIPLQGGTFLIDYFPVKLNPADFILVTATIIIIAVVASYFPARKAAMQQFIIREE